MRIAVYSAVFAWLFLTGCVQRKTYVEWLPRDENATLMDAPKSREVTHTELVFPWEYMPSNESLSAWGLWVGGAVLEMGTNARGNVQTPMTDALIPNPMTGTTHPTIILKKKD